MAIILFMETHGPLGGAGVRGHGSRSDASAPCRVDFESLMRAADNAQGPSWLNAGQRDMRIAGLEARLLVDREIIDELGRDALVTKEQIQHLEEALRTSRRIGAAVGIVMATLKVDESAAFAVLVEASQHSNVKLRDIADQLVHSGDVSELTGS